MIDAFYGHWLNPQEPLCEGNTPAHTHTGQPRSRALCFLTAEFLRVPAGAGITAFLQSQVCAARLGKIQDGHLNLSDSLSGHQNSNFLKNVFLLFLYLVLPIFTAQFVRLVVL